MKKNIFITFIAILTSFYLLINTATSNTKPDCSKFSLLTQCQTVTADSLALGWISSGNKQCQGGYQEKNIDYYPSALKALQKHAINIKAEQINFPLEGTIHLQGNVKITQPDRQLQATSIYLQRDKQGKLQQAKLHGNIRIQQPTSLLIGDSANVNIRQHNAWVEQALYRINSNQGLPAWGRAKKIIASSTNLFEIFAGSYSTCPPINPAWTLRAAHIKLNRNTGRGSARHTRLYLRDTPILYLPYFSFPIDKRRKTGVLFPTISHSENSGFTVSIPFYLNLAPNYDATLTPHYMSKRGTNYQAQFRYLTPENHGSLNIAYFPNDRVFRDFIDNNADSYKQHDWYDRLINASNNRKMIAWQHNTRFDEHWSSTITLNYVSDDYYYQDLAHFYAEDSTNNQLPRIASLTYQDQYWEVNAAMNGFQTLHPVNQNAVANQFKQLPHIVAHASYPTDYHDWDIDINLDLQFDNFQHVDDISASSLNTGEGQRYYLSPTLVASYNTMAGYLKSSLQLETIGYAVTTQGSGVASHVSRATPILNIDSSLVFERPVTWLATHYTQTLEPRLFYLLTPYKNQADIPVFDTSRPGFTYASLFRTNRFTGLDRVSDANQISVALSSRFLANDTGDEKFASGIGQIFYFRDRDVTLCNTDGCINDEYPNYQHKTSPLVAEASYHFHPDWRLLGNLSWNQNNKSLISNSFSFSYVKDNDRVANFGYNYSRSDDAVYQTTEENSDSDLRESYFSFVWPISSKAKALGRWNYNLQSGRVKTYFYGVEYNACCWALRFVTGRSYHGTEIIAGDPANKYDTAYYLQWQLNSLGSFGNRKARDLVTENITGYIDKF